MQETNQHEARYLVKGGEVGADAVPAEEGAMFGGKVEEVRAI